MLLRGKARQGLKGRNIIAQVVRPGFAIFPLNSGLKGRHIVVVFVRFN